MSLKMVLSGFLNHLEEMEMRRKLNDDIYELEFQKLKMLTETLKHNPDYSCNHGAQEINRCKNRYKDILPYDYTRVILTEDSDKPGSDYTNANYIKGATGSAAYIACQGPLPHTVIDFWRMIWECEVKVVIMACNEKEAGKQKCENYWPDEPKDFGNFHVELLKTQNVCSDFLIRKLKAKYKDEERTLYQFHYTTWPDHGVPTSVQPILHLVQMVRKFQSSDSVPILVHCSAGCGRTGTICAIDYVWRLMISGRLKEPFNLYEIISKMRQQRIAMVQTKEQYVLVHRAVAALFEQQLELIASHFYENIDQDGNPVGQDLKRKEEHIYEEVSCENIYSNLSHQQVVESVKEHKHQRATSDKEEECHTASTGEESPDCVQESKEVSTEDSLNRSLPVNDESHSKIPHLESVISSVNKNNADATVLHDLQKNKNEFSADGSVNSYEQNANFTLCLPLSATKGTPRNSDLLDTDYITSLTAIEDSVSFNLKIDNEGKVKVLQEKDDKCLQPSALSHFCSSASTNAKKKPNCNIENQHYLDSDSVDNSAISCKVHQDTKTCLSKHSEEKCECNDATFCQRRDFTTKEKHADIEEIFVEILSDNQTSFNLASSEKQHNFMRPSSSLVEGTKVDKNTSFSEASRTDFSNKKCESTEVDHSKVTSVKHKGNNNVISSKKDDTAVFHNLTDECTEASKKRYISLVTECEQSFSEIEKLLEEKNKTVAFENTHDKENITLLENQNDKIVHYNKLASVVACDENLVSEVNCPLNINESLIVSSESLQDSHPSSIHKQLENKVLNTDSYNELSLQSDPLVPKNDTALEYSKMKCLGIEEALKMKRVNEGSLEYIDSIGGVSDAHCEQLETKPSLSKGEVKSFNTKCEKNNGTEQMPVVLSKVNDAVPPDIKLIKCNVRTEVSRKEGTAYKRSGKIFDKDDIFSQYSQEGLSDVNSSLAHKVNTFEEDKSQTIENQVSTVIPSCKIDKNRSKSNSSVMSTHGLCLVNNTEVCKSENLVNDKSESLGGKVTVVQRPSITKLKALFEKTTTTNSDSNKQQHIKYPLLRSQSHRIYRSKSIDNDSDKERYSVRPTLLDKVTKILHLPSAESSSESSDRANTQLKSYDEKEMSFLNESKKIPRPVADAKENEYKSESYDILRDNSEAIKSTNHKLCDEIDTVCNTTEESRANEDASEESAAGCFDFSSLMSVVNREQNVPNTHWYEQERNSQRNREQGFDNEKLSPVAHSEQMKESCYANSNGSTGTKKGNCLPVTDNTEHHNQEEVHNIGNNIPPKLPTKKKYQNTFHSYIKNKDKEDSSNKTYNLLDDSSASKTNWYFENEENSSTGCEVQMVSTDDHKEANSNLDAGVVSENCAENCKYQPSTKWAEKPKLPQTETHITQPPLPPKKKNNNAEKTDWYCEELTSVHNDMKSKGAEIRTPLFHPYVNVLKTKDGVVIMDMDETDTLSKQSRPDLYTNVNTTSMKNIEQIENSLQQHPRGAIIDLTSRQSYANEQQSDIKPLIHGNDPKLSETVMTTDLEESHYNNEKPICDNFSESSFNLHKKRGESANLKKKTFTKKHYETLWPQNEVNEQAENAIRSGANAIHNQDIQADAKQNFPVHYNISEIENSNTNTHSPPSKPKLPSLGHFLSKSKSSSALSVKVREKNPVFNENSKFKDLYVNKVVCELNSILNGLTTKPFRSVRKDTSTCSEKVRDVEMPIKSQSCVGQPLAPPRRKPKNDHVENALEDANVEPQCHSAHVIKSVKQSEKILDGQKHVINTDVKPHVHHISKSKTMSDINKIKFVDASKRNSSHSKETGEHSRLPSVYENVDCMQSPTVSLENDVQQSVKDNKMSSTASKLKHSSSDASVFAVLWRTKSLNKVSGSQGAPCVSYEIKGNLKSEPKSYLKRKNPAASKQVTVPREDSTQQIIKVWENNLVQNEEQLTSQAKKSERRSMDDMDAFPIAPPRTRRHGPTPQKNVAAMKNFTSSLDEGIGHSKSQSLTRSTVTKTARDFEHLKLPSS